MSKETRNIHTDIFKSIISSSTGWDEAGDYGDIQFYNAELAIDTKLYKKGTIISTVTFLMNKGVCQLYQGDFFEEFNVVLSPVFGS